MAKSGNAILQLPCGLAVGSSIALVATPRCGLDRVCQFTVELKDTKNAETEDPPRILHFNPRLKGDWSGKPVIELNSMYKMQWASAQRCRGQQSKGTVDGLFKCEKWGPMPDNGQSVPSEESANRIYLFVENQMTESGESVPSGKRENRAFPFVGNQKFLLTINSGLEGYHMYVDGIHVTSFAYRPTFGLEDATHMCVQGDIDVHSVVASSLPATDPSLSPQPSLEIWKASPLPTQGPPVELFIGILSSARHFPERMAIRKTWMHSAQRCHGRQSKGTVDGLFKCEKWGPMTDNGQSSPSEKRENRIYPFVGNQMTENGQSVPSGKIENRTFPFVENQKFVLKIIAGSKGYHMYVDGIHVTSFAYRTTFGLEDATYKSIEGDIDVHSVVASSLPPTDPSLNMAPQPSLDIWKASPLPTQGNTAVDLFIGILSSSIYFSERMAIRKTWMQSEPIRSSRVVARFFVALSSQKDMNMKIFKEADFYGDMVIVPYIESYDLVVLKTIAICQYGVRSISAKYVMKCDDDTFVRVDAILKQINEIYLDGKALYMGNMNFKVPAIRTGKWAVTLQEWPEATYPLYANGGAYILSRDIASFIVSKHENRTLSLFRMEDVSVGIWAKQFKVSHPLRYSHSLKLYQSGCAADYYTVHYQSPRQMLCMWNKLSKGRAQCCNK